MQPSQTNLQPKPKGRPPGNSQASVSVQIVDEGEFIVLKIPKKMAAKLLLKDLI